jgi:precorrin-6Y C5,15-methyltransferase (decarboxylating)
LKKLTPGIPDYEFLSDEKLPSTPREEIRAISISKLRPTEGGVYVDIGAGNGSITVELAKLGCMVYSIDLDPNAISLITINTKRHGVEKFVKVMECIAPSCLQGIKGIDGVYIGGGRSLREVISWAKEALRLGGRIVISSSKLETIIEAMSLVKEMDEVEAIQVQISKVEKNQDGRHFISSKNPVFIVSATKK